MLKVAVRLTATIADVGEYLADVTALEAAGADTIWVDDSVLDPWIVLGVSASPTSVLPGGTSTVSADMTDNSAMADTVALNSGVVTFWLMLAIEIRMCPPRWLSRSDHDYHGSRPAENENFAARRTRADTTVLSLAPAFGPYP